MDLSLVIKKLKNEYDELYCTEFSDGAVFIWRPLSPFEYKSIYNNESLTPFQKEEAFCYLCTLYSVIGDKKYKATQYDFSSQMLPGGYPTILAGEIISISGFGDDDTAERILEQYNAEMETFDNQIPCIIKMAFGDDVSFYEIEHWSLRKIFYHLSRAQWILNTKSTLASLAITGRAPQNIVPYTPQMKPTSNGRRQKIRKRSREELEQVLAKWNEIEWGEIGEEAFLNLSRPDDMETYEINGRPTYNDLFSVN